MQDLKGKRIFISPVDWGLGHATRCVPLIRKLAENNTVVIGVTPLNAAFFNRHFPELSKAELPSYKISYSEVFPAWLKVLLQWPRIHQAIKNEKERLEKIILHYNIDLVISDNRYGLIHKDTRCIFMGHQLRLNALMFTSFVNRVNRHYIHRFGEVWVPDYENKARRLAGELSTSDAIRIPVRYIGPLSMLSYPQAGKSKEDQPIDYLILLSGVEPQRSRIEELLIGKLDDPRIKTVLVRGSAADFKFKTRFIKVMDLVYGEDLARLIVNSGTVICRSGYSTLMDMHALNKKELILIPTPGQTEQEYLAAYWKKKFGARILLQKHIGSFQADI